MKITVLTMMPMLFASILEEPQIVRAKQKGIAEVEIVDIRQYAGGSYRHVDDSPFGGGAGMVMRAHPILRALREVRTESSRVYLLSPAGEVYAQQKAREFSALDHLILICGHYEGVDERIMKEIDGLICMGDYILTGGEIGAMAIIDSCIRLLPGILRKESTEEESFENGLLEYPQYTQPADLEGDRVPEILLSGNHEKIRRWRLTEAIRRTLKYRPDLLKNREFSEEEKEILESVQIENSDC